MSFRKRVWFIVFNVIQTILAALLLFTSLITIANGLQYDRYEPGMLIAATISFIIILTSCYNLFLATKYNEDYSQKRFGWTLTISSLCFNGLLTLFILFIMCFGAYEEFFDGSESEDIMGKIMVFVVAAWALISIFIFVWQLQLVRKIKRSNQLQLETLIDSIGSEKEDKL